MSTSSQYNPFSFRTTQVTIIATVLYLVLLGAILSVHYSVPPAPENTTPQQGINLTSAWLDLEELSEAFRPWNSRRNEVVRDWLVDRVQDLASGNGKSVSVLEGTSSGSLGADSDVVIWKDTESNATFVDSWRQQPWTCYTESQNVIVYIRGEDDEQGAWWNSSKSNEFGGVLVNAHYDSVSTGYGATDDGVGVVTILQLISYFTSTGQTPQRGLLALLNNGEEDGLYGAHAFSQHPASKFPRIFLNLEGAGAGGRATLFRSTDAEVTGFYSSVKSPFGSVISADGFKRGLVRSGTDYSVFTEDLNLRGLDVAFMAPRSRYHTDQDDARNTNLDSVWHMLSAALSTTKAMTGYTGDDFQGVNAGNDGVWFDLLGSAFVVLELNTLFALCVTLLVVGPLLLVILEVFIAKQDKWYPFARKEHVDGPDENDEEPIPLHGIRGFARFPLSLFIAVIAVVALAYLLTKVNPYILYRSPLVVWTLFLSAFFAVSWFLLNLGDRVRPTALMKWYSFLWIYVFSWIALVLATVGAHNFGVAGGYIILIYNASVFLAFVVGYLEFFALPKRQKYVQDIIEDHDHQEHEPEGGRAARDGDEATERTGLLSRGGHRDHDTFTGIARRSTRDTDDGHGNNDSPHSKAYPGEQAWSANLPTWTWLIQYLLVVPINVILVGQFALLSMSALHQTPADGNPVLSIYLIMAALTVLLLVPLLPFLQRFSFHLPLLLLVAFIGCLIWTMLAFPFDREARMKYYFVQNVDLATGTNNVSISGIDGYIQQIIGQLPSAAGQSVNCGDTSSGLRNGLATCSWEGLHPNVVASGNTTSSTTPEASGLTDWVTYNVTAINSTTASFTFQGRETKNCRVIFDTPVQSVSIAGAATDPRHEPVGEGGSTQLRLFSRDWEKEFQVNVSWAVGREAKGQKGRLGCLWAEADRIPALQELKRFEPVWSAVTKHDDGLVVGWRHWKI